MPRDRLKDLKAAQNEDERDDAEVLEIEMRMGNMDGYMSDFFPEMEELRGKLNQIQEDSNNVKRVQDDILLNTTTDEKMQQKLDDLMVNIKRSSQQVRSKLKEMETDIEKAEEYSDSQAEIRIRRTQYNTISKTFVDLMTEYNAIQTSYRERCKGRIQRQMDITGNKVTDDELEAMLEKGEVQISTMEVKTDADMREQKMILEDIHARHNDIIKLENSIKELHTMFVDMAVLVESQGEMIDRIEVNVVNAVEWVDRANADMKVAREYQSKARRKKLMIIACASIGAVVLIAIVKAKLGL